MKVASIVEHVTGLLLLGFIETAVDDKREDNAFFRPDSSCMHSFGSFNALQLRCIHIDWGI